MSPNEQLEFEDSAAKNSRERLLYSRFEKSSKTPTLISFLISKGIIKNDNSARLFILILTIIIFALSIYLISDSLTGPVFIDKINK